MNRMVKVNFRNIVTKEFAADTTLLEISHSFKKYYNYPILIAKVDNDIANLSETITRKCTIEFCDRSSPEGNAAYGRSVQFLLVVAVKKVLGEEAEIVIEHSLDNGVYCEIHGVEIDKPIIKKIEDKMLELVKQDFLYVKVSVSRWMLLNILKRKSKWIKYKY